MGDGMHAVLPSQFGGSLPQRFRQLRPPRLTASKLLQLSLQLRDWFWNRCSFTIHYQPPLATD
jgi:hypothetical protein